MFYIGYIIYLYIWFLGSKYLDIAIGSGLFVAVEGYFEIELLKLSVYIKYLFMIAPLLRFIIKDWKKKDKVLPICWLSSFILIIVLCVLNIICGIRFQKFEPELWQECPKLRWLMSTDLLDRYLVENLTVEEVEALLGTPDNSYVLEGKTVYEYDTYIDCDRITVVFNDNICEKIRYNR